MSQPPLFWHYIYENHLFIYSRFHNDAVSTWGYKEWSGRMISELWIEEDVEWNSRSLILSIRMEFSGHPEENDENTKLT
jgi:hypothetical protein